MRDDAMIRRLVFLSALVLVAGCHGPSNPSGANGPATLNSLSLTGQTSFSATNQSAQWTVFGNFSDGRRPDLTAQATWAVQNAAVATISPSGSVRTIGYGSTSITA